MSSKSSEATQRDRNVQIKKYTMICTINEYIHKGTTGSSQDGWTSACHKRYEWEVTLGTGSLKSEQISYLSSTYPTLPSGLSLKTQN